MASLQRILIVEDEPLIAMMLEDFLEALGKTHVATCDSVTSALAAREIPFILSTGGGEDMPAHAARPRLVKPYTMENVAKALAEL